MTKASEKFDFGAGLAELEAITAWFEGEQIDLDEGLKKFERGMELSAQLKAHLDVVENRVEQIKVKPAEQVALDEEPSEPTSPDALF